MEHSAYGRRPTLMPALAFAGLALIGAVPWLASTRLEAAAPPRYAIVRVRAGDDLWTIARGRTRPGADVRETVDRLMQINRLSDPGLVPGEILRLPAE